MNSKNLDLKQIIAKLKQLKRLLFVHLPFVITIAVLMVYLVLIWNIKNLIVAEPTLEAEQQTLAEAQIPKIDQRAINQIQSLENNSPAIRSLFDEARNNPFSE